MADSDKIPEYHELISFVNKQLNTLELLSAEKSDTEKPFSQNLNNNYKLMNDIKLGQVKTKPIF